MCDECTKRIDDLSEQLAALAARHAALAETVFSAMLISDARTLDALSQQLARRIDGAVARGETGLAGTLAETRSMIAGPSVVMR
jgi:hypothetical protein